MRFCVIALLTIGLAASLPAAPPKPSAPVPQAVADECKPSKIQRLDALVGGHRFSKLADTKLGRAGMSVWDKVNDLGGRLTGAIKRKLDPGEQRQAEAATTIAVCAGIPGREVKWTSATHAGVTGSSTVSARNQLADGTSCMTVRDVVFSNGEETVVSKRMCRAPGASGYALAS